MAIDISDAGGGGTVTITNTFEPEVIDDVVDPPADDVVVASPTVTG